MFILLRNIGWGPFSGSTAGTHTHHPAGICWNAGCLLLCSSNAPKRLQNKWKWIKFVIADLMQKVIIEKSRECHNHKQQPIPGTKRKSKRMRNKQTDARETHRPALSSPSEVITKLNRTKKKKKKKNTRTKYTARLDMKLPVVQTTKQHKLRIKPEPPA